MTPEVPSQQSPHCKALMNECSLAALAHKSQNTKMKGSDLNPVGRENGGAFIRSNGHGPGFCFSTK